MGELEEADKGIYEMKELLYGKYLVKETKAPEGFVLDEGVYSVFIEENGKTYQVENEAGVGFINDAMRGLSLIHILMVESNYQRSQILPSEKAFAYKMRLEAMNRKAGRPSKENLTPVESDYEKLRTNEKFANEVGESREQIRRYIRLTNLVPELLEFVDEGRIKMRPAVELSYLCLLYTSRCV